jgi:hypothetical protein
MARARVEVVLAPVMALRDAPHPPATSRLTSVATSPSLETCRAPSHHGCKPLHRLDLPPCCLPIAKTITGEYALLPSLSFAAQRRFLAMAMATSVASGAELAPSTREAALCLVKAEAASQCPPPELEPWMGTKLTRSHPDARGERQS